MKMFPCKLKILVLMLSIFLLLAVCWLCFYHGPEKKEPDGTLVWQEVWRTELGENKNVQRKQNLADVLDSVCEAAV